MSPEAAGCTRAWDRVGHDVVAIMSCEAVPVGSGQGRDGVGQDCQGTSAGASIVDGIVVVVAVMWWHWHGRHHYGAWGSEVCLRKVPVECIRKKEKLQ